MTRSLSLAFLAHLVLAGVLAGLASAQSPAPDAKSGGATSKEKLDFYRKKLEKLRLTPAGEASKPFQFVAEPLTTFENPISQIWDGLMFVWTDRGRPAAAMKCYYQPSPYNHWGRTFVSLATERIELVSGDTSLWTPEEAGLSFNPLPDAPQPADDARRRLTQMRDIARRFEIVDKWGLKDPTDWRLRLLPQPLYRYESPDEGVVDGAMFGYVANSPEALVLVELRKAKEGLSWHYAAARFTRFQLTISLDDKQIVEFPRLNAWPPTGVYFHHPLELPDFPFERPESPEAPKK